MPEGDFVDSEVLPSSNNHMDSRSLSIRAPISDDIEDDDVEEIEDEEMQGEDDEGSSVSDESFDSALDAMAVASNADAPSSVGSLNEPAPEDFSVEELGAPQQGALRQLNELNSGVSSLDTSLLDDCSEEEFKKRVFEIAESKNLSSDDEVIRSMVDALLPIVRGRFTQSSFADDKLLHDRNSSKVYFRVMPVAKPTAEDDDDTEGGDEEDAFEVQRYKESHSDTDQAEEDLEGNGVQPDSARGFRVRGADTESARGLRILGADSENDFEESEDQMVDINGPLLIQPESREGEAAVVPANREQPDESESVAFGTDLKTDSNGAAVMEFPAGTGSERELNETEAASSSDETVIHPREIENLEQVVVKSVDAVSPKEELEPCLFSEGPSSPDETVSHPPREIENLEQVCDKGVDAVSPKEELEPPLFSEGPSSPRETVIYPQEIEDFEQVGDKSVDAVSPKAEVEPSLFSEVPSSPDETVIRPREIENLEQVGDESVDAVSPKEELEPSLFSQGPSSQSQEGRSLDEVVDATSLEHGPEDSPHSNPVMEDIVQGKSTTVEDPVSVNEHNSTQVEPVVVVEKKNEKEISEGNPNAVLDSNVAPNKERSAAQDMVLNKREEEESEDDDTREKESVSVNTARLAAFVNSKASTAPATDMPSLGGAGPSLPVRPAGLGRSVPSLEHAPRAAQRSIGPSQPPTSRARENNPSSSDVSEDHREAREKLQMIRVKFLRLAHRLGQSAHNVVVAQVLYRLGLAEQLRGGRGISTAGAFSFERASLLAEEQEAAEQDELEFGCTIMVLGKSGVGKSATINSLFDEVKSGTDAYSPATRKVREITGTIHGIKVTVIDTPGLLPSFADQRHNEKVMSSVKRFIKKSPPDIVLYFDRLDMQSRDYGDLPLLRTITDTFGAAVWFNAIVVLTHASSAPPDGANGVPLSYEMFVAQRSHVVQQTIRQAAGDMRLMNPVSLVENHGACRTNRAGQRVLPNGQVWKPQLLLLCFSSKILAEANSLLKLQDSSQGKPFGVRPRVPPLPFLLSSLLQSRAQLRLPDEQVGDDDLSDEDLEEDADSESDEEYDDLPPFRRLTKEELQLLDNEQRRTYFDELDYREKLFMKQQWKEERLRRREFRRRKAGALGEESQPFDESFEAENVGSAAVPVPMPDLALPQSFDSDSPSHRYRYLDTATQWLVRPVLETHGWDHDSGYDGLNIEKVFVISKKIPASVSGQITKDKKEANLQMECAASFKNGENKVTLAGLDVQTIGKDLAYTLRSETRFSNFRRNKTTCGLAVTFLGDTVAAGMKLEDALMVGRRFKLVLNGGAITGRGDVAYGGSLEATLRGKDYPLVHSLASLGLSIMDWHGDLAIGGNAQSQFMLGKTLMIARANLNNRGAGQISIRASSSEQLQMALIGLIPLLKTFSGSRIFNSTQPLQ